MDLHLWLAYVAAAFLIAVSPGSGAVLSMSVGLRHGYWHALAGIAGLQTALLLQLALVATGLGALLAASETAFLVVKLVGECHEVLGAFMRGQLLVMLALGAESLAEVIAFTVDRA